MIDVGTLVMKVDADTKKFEKGVSIVNKGMNGIGKAVVSAGKVAAVGITAAGAAATAIGVKSVQAGADAEEMLNKYNVVFNGMTSTVDKWASDYSDKVGRSVYDTKEYLSNLADLQQGLGMTADESFDLSKKIVELGTDLASFNNLQDDEAIDALSKAMLGEAESAKKLGLLLNVDRVKDYAEAQGLVYKELSDARKATLVYELAVSQSKNAIGDAERSADSYTNQMKRLQTSIEDSTKSLGMKLIPIATDVVQKINKEVLPSMDGWIDKAFELGEDAVDSFGKVRSWWDENGDNIKTKGMDVFNGIKTVGGDLVTSLRDDVIPIFEATAKAVDQNWGNMKTSVTVGYNLMKAAAGPLVRSLRDDVIKNINDTSDTINRMYSVFSESFNIAFGNASDETDTLAGKINLLADALENLQAKMPDWLKNGLSRTINPFGAVNETINEFLDDVENLNYIQRGHQSMREETGIFTTGLSASEALRIGKANAMNASGDYGAAGVINVNVSGNTIMNDRDMDKLIQKQVDALKRKGVFVP